MGRLFAEPVGTGECRGVSAGRARIAGRRWDSRESFTQSQSEVGLDQYEVRFWTGWHRYMTLAMTAQAFPGHHPGPRRVGTDAAQIQFYVFAGSGSGHPMTSEEIDSRVKTLLPSLRAIVGLATPIVG